MVHARWVCGAFCGAGENYRIGRWNLGKHSTAPAVFHDDLPLHSALRSRKECASAPPPHRTFGGLLVRANISETLKVRSECYQPCNTARGSNVHSIIQSPYQRRINSCRGQTEIPQGAREEVVNYDENKKI